MKGPLSLPEVPADPKAERLLRVQRDLDTIEDNVRLFVIDGDEKEVPEVCKKGFNNWHPRNPDCTTCVLVPLCFSKATDTAVVIVEVAKRKTRQKREPTMGKRNPETEEAAVMKALNPFREGTAHYNGRLLYLKILETGTTTFAGIVALEEFATEHKIPRVNPVETHAKVRVMQMLRLSKSRHDEPPKHCDAFFGTVTHEGAKPVSMTLKIDVSAGRIAAEKLKDEALAAFAEKSKEREGKQDALNAKRDERQKLRELKKEIRATEKDRLAAALAAAEGTRAAQVAPAPAPAVVETVVKEPEAPTVPAAE